MKGLKADSENAKESFNQLKKEMENSQAKINQIKDELALKENELESTKSLLNSLRNNSSPQNYLRLRDKLVNKIYSADPDNEDLMSLMNLDVLEVFKKYEEFKKSAEIKIDETTETIQELKSKLRYHF